MDYKRLDREVGSGYTYKGISVVLTYNGRNIVVGILIVVDNGKNAGWG